MLLSKLKSFTTKQTLIFLFCFALLIRIASIFTIANLENPEMWEFGKIARNLLAGLGYSHPTFQTTVPSAYMPPGLSYIYYFFFKIFGDNSTSYILILTLNSLLASFSAIIIYKLAMKIYEDKTIALMSSIYIAFSPILIFSTINFNSIIIYQVLIGLIFIYFMKSYSRPEIINLRTVVMLSILLGIFLYFRSEMLAFTLLIASLFVIKKKFYTPVRLWWAALILLIPILIISPWSIRNYIVFGKIIPITTSFGYNFYIGHSDQDTDRKFNKRIFTLKEDSTFELKMSELGIETALEHIKEKPEAEIIVSLNKIKSLWITDDFREQAKHPLYLIVWIPTLIFFTIGYYKSLKSKSYRDKLFFLNIYLIFSTLLAVVFFNLPRYQIQMSFIMIPTAMHGLYLTYNYIYRIIKRNKNFTNESNKTK